MRWKGRRQSSNVEDTRGQRAPRGRGAKVGGGLGGFGLIAAVVFVLLGGDPSLILGLLGGGGSSVATQPSAPAQSGTRANDEAGQFASVILADLEDTWNGLFRRSGSTYREPKLRLFTDVVDSACGRNTSATGPFYCPPDERLFLDLGFFDQLQQLGAPGDFAQAYVIAHEVAHHVQNITGVLDRVRQQQGRASKAEANALQVRVELQADCYAGVWAYYADRERQMLETGDVEEGLRAAAAIGDDTLQKRAGQRVRPESFTHGSSEQRMQWFRRGMDTGDVQACDTFAR